MNPYFQFPEPFTKIIEELCLKETGCQTSGEFIQKFSPEIQKISDFFNQKTGFDERSSTLSSPAFPLAYIAYFLPSNFLKLAAVLLDFHQVDPSHPLFSPQKPDSGNRTFRVLDLGSGPGTNGLGLLDFCARFPESFFNDRTIEYVAVDRDRWQLHYFSLLFSSYFQSLGPFLSSRGIRFKIQTVQKQLSSKLPGVEGRFDLIILGNLLNEMIQQGHSIPSLAEWAKSILRLLTARGTLFFIEPALRKTSRNLLALRNLLVLQKTGSIIAPCLHQKPCPILEPQGLEKDWCHQEKKWGAPEWIQKIDRIIGKRKDALKYSYLIVSRPEKPPIHPPFRWRTVSEVMETRGKKEAFLCNETGRIRFYLLDRETGVSNHLFSTLNRGDLVEIGHPENSKGSRILTDWTVRKSNED